MRKVKENKAKINKIDYQEARVLIKVIIPRGKSLWNTGINFF